MVNEVDGIGRICMTLLDLELAAQVAGEHLDPQVLHEELTTVFRRSWQVAVPAADVAQPGALRAPLAAGGRS